MTMGTSKRRDILGMAAAGILGMGAERSHATPADDLTGTLNVSTFKQTSYLTAYYLQRFAPAGLKINLIETTSNTDAIDALVTGSIDVGYMGVIACIIAASRGRPLQAVASVASRTTRVMVRADSPYKTIADLKGKTVGIAKATNQDIIFRELVREAGLDPKKDIDFILVPTPSQVAALADHTVEAVSTSEPNGSILLLSGIGRELVKHVNHTRVGNPGILVALTADLIAKRPALAQMFVTMHAKTTIWMLHNTEQLITDFAKMARLKEDVVRLAMSNTAHHYNINDTYMHNITELSDSLVDANYLAAGYDVRKAFDLQFLPAARKAAGEVV